MSLLRSRAVTAVMIVFWLPAWLPHEALHALVASPWARVQVRLLPRPHVTMRFRPDAPGWAISLACLAPTLVGVLVLPLVSRTIGVPGSIFEAWLLLCCFMFVFPSTRDLLGAVRPHLQEPSSRSGSAASSSEPRSRRSG